MEMDIMNKMGGSKAKYGSPE